MRFFHLFCESVYLWLKWLEVLLLVNLDSGWFLVWSNTLMLAWKSSAIWSRLLMFEMDAYFVGFFGLKKLAESWVLVSFSWNSLCFVGLKAKRELRFGDCLSQLLGLVGEIFSVALRSLVLVLKLVWWDVWLRYLCLFLFFGLNSVCWLRLLVVDSKKICLLGIGFVPLLNNCYFRKRQM